MIGTRGRGPQTGGLSFAAIGDIPIRMGDADDRPFDVLLISAGVGAGHNQAAKAILEGLRLAQPGLPVRQIDALDYVSSFFRAYYADGFAFSMTHLARLYGAGFWLTDHPQRPGRGLGERVRLAWERRFLGRLEQLLLEKRPRLIVHTHFLSPPAVSRLIRKHGLTSRQIVAVTDIVVHRWWYAEDVDHYFLPAPTGLERLERWGIEPARITVSGMPIHPKWVQPLDREKIYATWRLPRDKRIVVLTGGTIFTCGPIVRIANEILAACPDAAVVVLAGRNKDLLADLSRQPHAGTRLFPQGFTDRGHELLEIADVMITKPGGITTAECLSKALPMVLLKPVPGQEGGNARYFEQEKVALVARSPADIVAAAGKLLSDRALRDAMSANARKLFRYGTAPIMEYVLKAVGH